MIEKMIAGLPMWIIPQPNQFTLNVKYDFYQLKNLPVKIAKTVGSTGKPWKNDEVYRYGLLAPTALQLAKISKK